MQRVDRINFPQVTSEELWSYDPDDCSNSSECDASPAGLPNESNFIPRIGTPLLVSPQRVDFTKSPEIPSYLYEREKHGLVTPAQTPSDILRRGPLYESTLSEADTEPTSGHAFDAIAEDRISERIEYHQERQREISRFVDAFCHKMDRLRLWHKDQETKYANTLVASPANFPRNSVE